MSDPIVRAALEMVIDRHGPTVVFAELAASLERVQAAAASVYPLSAGDGDEYLGALRNAVESLGRLAFYESYFGLTEGVTFTQLCREGEKVTPTK